MFIVLFVYNLFNDYLLTFMTFRCIIISVVPDTFIPKDPPQTKPAKEANLMETLRTLCGSLLLIMLAGAVIWVPILLAYLDSVDARKCYEEGRESAWIELNGSPGPQSIWAYYLVAWFVGAKCERSVRIGTNGAAGMVITNFEYKLLRFVPK